jgi:DNA-binding transcriptional ArsR family regulator
MSRRQVRSDVFQAIADPIRRSLLDQLRGGEGTVRSLAERFAVTLSAVSQHLGVLRAVGLVSFRRNGRERVYRLNPEPLKQVSDWLAFYQGFWQARLEALDRHLSSNP